MHHTAAPQPMGTAGAKFWPVSTPQSRKGPGCLLDLPHIGGLRLVFSSHLSHSLPSPSRVRDYYFIMSLLQPMLQTNPTRVTSPGGSSYPGRAAALPDNSAAKNLEPDRYGLREEVEKILDRNPIGLAPEGKWLPDHEYDTLFHRDAIQRALGGSLEKLPVVEFVREKAMKTFASLLLTFSDCGDRFHAMESLMRTGFTDDALPTELDLCPCQSPCQNSGHRFRYRNPWDPKI